MSWISIKEYIQQFGISDSTIRRRIKAGQIKSKRISGKWYVFKENETSPRQNADQQPISNEENFEKSLSSRFEFPKFSNMDNSEGSLKEIIAFSSKALNSYLMISDRLIGEHEKRIKELDSLVGFQKQVIAELESYVKALEAERIVKHES